MNPAIAKIINLPLNTVPVFSLYDNRSAPIITQDGEQIRRFVVKFREPLFKNGYIQGVRNSIEFQNVGNTKVLINGNWTLLAGGSKKFDAGNDVNVTDQTFTIYFPDDPFNALAGNRLEVSEVILDEKSVAFFSPRGIQKQA